MCDKTPVVEHLNLSLRQLSRTDFKSFHQNMIVNPFNWCLAKFGDPGTSGFWKMANAVQVSETVFSHLKFPPPQPPPPPTPFPPVTLPVLA